MLGGVAAALLSLVIVSAADEDLIPGQSNTPIGFDTSCKLKVKTAGSSSSRETYNGDIMFFKGSQQVLLVGLHPEWNGGKLAIKNPVFKRGSEQWGYQWVGVDFPNHSGGRKREYTFEFRSNELVLLCQGNPLITIPYSELTSDKEGFLSGINTVKMKMDDFDFKFGKICGGSFKPIPKLILYSHGNQQGRSVTLHGPTPKLQDLSFNDDTDSVWAVIGDWELYTGAFYEYTRFFVQEGHVRR